MGGHRRVPRKRRDNWSGVVGHPYHLTVNPNACHYYTRRRTRFYIEVKFYTYRIGSGYILPDDWSEDFKWVLQLERKPKLSIADKRQCNKLFRKYLGYV